MADIGTVSLLLALALTVYSAAALVLGVRGHRPELTASGRNGVWATFGLVSLAVAIMIYLLLNRQFQVEYVASYTSRDLPLFYTASALWAGQKGSLLFWGWLLALFAVLVMEQNREKNRELMPYVLAVMMACLTFFLLLMTAATNPFERLPFTPADGQGLNPLLQNPGMVFHPPTLYLGYVGFTVPFAFALAALITGRLSDVWIRSTRRWTLFSWLLLSIGVLLGAQWAYVELGWGGYWNWDPVENASLMPWLTGTAFLHSVMIQERRGMLKVWNMILIILTFSLALFGTFITRSGIIESVHAFGVSTLGPYFLGFIGITLIVSLGLLFEKLDHLRSENELDSLLSRESTFLLNNLILVGAAFAVFWGTIFPMISEAITHRKVTVGPPFFNRVNGPIFLVLILLIGICPLIGWRRASKENLMRNFLYPLVVSIVVAAVLYLLGVTRYYALLSFAICAFVATTILSEFWRGLRAQLRLSGRNYWQALVMLINKNRRRYGGYIVHLGIVLLVVGVTGSSFYQTDKEATLAKGETMTIGGYTLRYDDFSSYPTQNKQVVAATLSVFRRGKAVGRVVPSKDFHRNAEQPMTEVAIRTTALEDLYVILAGWEGDGSTITLKVVINPLVVWMWVGGIILLLGTGIAFWPDPREERVLARIRAREIALEAAR
ncbi:MAG: heme lyase CcmF/NrfE family subunit [Anaerolineae bacterium]